MTDQLFRRRLPHIHLDGHVVFVTFRLSPRQPGTLGEAERDDVATHIGRMAPGKLWAFVVMPDHVHLVYQPGPGEALSRSLQALKGASSHTLTHRHGRRAPVWQDESFDHVVRGERELVETWRYVEANPVRKELCTAPEEYRWSSAWGRGGLRSAGEGACATTTPAVQPEVGRAPSPSQGSPMEAAQHQVGRAPSPAHEATATLLKAKSHGRE